MLILGAVMVLDMHVLFRFYYNSTIIVVLGSRLLKIFLDTIVANNMAIHKYLWLCD